MQSGPTCTQLLAYMGADCIKVERPGVGDITRGQLRDVKGADSLYFTMLNGNKRSITIDSKNPKGKEILERLIKYCDVLVENFAPGALDRMGLTWEHIHKTQSAHDRRLGQGLRPRPLRGLQGLRERRAMRRRRGVDHRLPRGTAARHRRADRRLAAPACISPSASWRRSTSASAPAAARRCSCAMQDGVLNLARVKLRDQQRLAHGPLTEYSQYGEGVPFGKAVPRAGNDSGGGQPGWILKCKGWETDPDAYIYFITQAPVWEAICDLIGKPEWKTDPDYATPPARLPRLKHIFDTIEEWTMTKTKFEVMEICNKVDIPVGPILSMKEIAEEQSLRETGTVVEVDHPDARQVSDRRQSGEDVGLDHRGEALAAARRAHRGNPDQGARLFGQGDWPRSSRRARSRRRRRSRPRRDPRPVCGERVASGERREPGEGDFLHGLGSWKFSLTRRFAPTSPRKRGEVTRSSERGM